MENGIACGYVGHHLTDRDDLVPLVSYAEIGQVFDHGRIEIDFSALHQLRNGRGNESLGDRGHVEERTWCYCVVFAC